MPRDKKILFAILGIGLVLRLFRITSAPLWYDEGFTAWVSSVPFANAWAAITGDVHPPLYYLITWAIVHLTGAADHNSLALALRLASAPFSIWAVYLTYAIGKALRLAERGVLAATIYMAVSPMQIFFAQEGRMYAMFQAVVLLAFLGAVTGRRSLIALGLALSIWLQNYGLIYWGTIGLVMLAFHLRKYQTLGMLPRKHLIMQDFLAFSMPLVLWIPWIAFLSHQMTTVSGGYWILPPTLGDILSAYYYILGGIAQTPEFHAVSVMIVFGATILTIYRIAKDRVRHIPLNVYILVIFGFIPLAAAIIGSYLWKPILLYRGILPSSAALSLLIGNVLANTRRNAIISACLIIPVTISALWIQYYQNPKGGKDVETIIEMIREEWQPGDIIYHVDAGSMVGFWLHARDLPQYLAPHCENQTLGSLSNATRNGLGIIERNLDDIEYNRAWVIYAVGPTARACMVRDYAYLAQGDSWIITEDSEYVLSGVWVHDK